MVAQASAANVVANSVVAVLLTLATITVVDAFKYKHSSGDPLKVWDVTLNCSDSPENRRFPHPDRIHDTQEQFHCQRWTKILAVRENCTVQYCTVVHQEEQGNSQRHRSSPRAWKPWPKLLDQALSDMPQNVGRTNEVS